MAIKKGDFIELEYTAKVKGENIVFDTTDEKIAKEQQLHQEGASYGPVIICVGEVQVLKGMDEALEGKEPGKAYTFDIIPEKGFGKKDAKLLRLIPTAKFRQQKIAPMPGLQVDIDGIMGIVKTVTGGRVIVDFNHPLSGRELEYQVSIKRIVNDAKEQLQAVFTMNGIKDAQISLEGQKAVVTLPIALPEKAVEPFKEGILKMVKDLKAVEFIAKKDDEESQEKTHAHHDHEKKPEPKRQTPKPVQKTATPIQKKPEPTSP